MAVQTKSLLPESRNQCPGNRSVETTLSDDTLQPYFALPMTSSRNKRHQGLEVAAASHHPGYHCLWMCTHTRRLPRVQLILQAASCWPYDVKRLPAVRWGCPARRVRNQVRNPVAVRYKSGKGQRPGWLDTRPGLSSLANKASSQGQCAREKD